MHSEMRIAETPPLEHFKEKLEARLRIEAISQRRVIFPPVVVNLAHRLKALVKPLVQSGAMAMTAIVIIIAISATPAATSGDLVVPLAAPLSAPGEVPVYVPGESGFLDLLPPEDVLASQIPDNSDIVTLELE